MIGSHALSDLSCDDPRDDSGGGTSRHGDQQHAGFRLFRRKRSSAGGLACWIALPDRVDPKATPFVAVHGIHRDARTQALLFGRRAAELGRVVIAPRFSERQWQGYQQVYGKRRADRALLELLDELSASLPIDTSRFDLFGYSGGAQFAHRFALAYPQRVACLHTLSAGWYSFPDGEPFPYGLGQPVARIPGFSPLLKASLAHFLSLPIRVYVGEHDNVVDEHVRSGAAIDHQQGLHRLERGQRWVGALCEAARVRGVDADIRFHALPGSGHDFKTCVERGGLLDAVMPARPVLLAV